MKAATAWAVVWLTAVSITAIKMAGPLLAGSRELSAPALRVVALLAPALLSALVVTNALADGDQVRIGADTVGVLAGMLLLWRGAPVWLIVAAAASVTAGLRAAGLT